ncbi:ABC transporter ATP-binding protein [Methanocella sp. CWC-04]|uniref:ABC transporter ATP-binding protein n=1 Tax=Methanooceanicella nereidis TaxID=2052831 RepID=A0AAP2RDV0_9EURY|nr:ABC transporter ATP-binding protein [Methanocella sp. CWC-04]MCD1294377.1 ABC transporter ATP-binding protein [Methanocella sp. CWC-04]
MSNIAIHTDALTRDFKNIRAVNEVTLEVPSGIVFGFLGPNGSGKTTMIRLLLGLLEPSTGSAKVLGFDTMKQADEIRARSGALLEFNGLYERLSAEDNLEFYGKVWKMPAQERKERIKELLTHMNLWDRRGEKVGNWSRGMKQKLAVSRAMLHRPSLLFLDEPTAGLDPIAASGLRDDLDRLVKSEGVTVFLTTHNLVEAERLCKKVGVINKGKLIAVGHPDELRARTGSPQVEIVGRGFNDIVMSSIRSRPEVASVEMMNDRLVVSLNKDAATSGLVSAIVSAGGEIEEVRKGTASLEDAFLAMMEVEE